MALLEPEGIWLGACITPWAIAPHPNFTPSGRPSQAQLLALLSEFRVAEYDRLIDMSEDKEPEEFLLVRAIRNSLTISGRTMPAGLEELDLAERNFGMRSAHALFLSRSLAWNGFERQAVEVLSTLAESQEGLANPLSRAVLLSAAAHRALDLGDHEAASAHAVAARSSSAKSLTLSFEEFPTSPGVSWKWDRVIQDCRDNVEELAQRTIASVDPNSDGWVDIIRRRGTWTQRRRQQLSAQRDEHLRNRLFDRGTNAHDRSTTFHMKATDHDEALAAVSTAELGGSFGEWRSARSALAQCVYLLEVESDVTWASEMLWTFWLARSDKDLRRVADEVRAEGPLAAMVKVGDAILKSERTWHRTQAIDFEFLTKIVDLLDKDLLSEALELCNRCLNSEWLERADFAGMRALARCIDALLQELGAESREIQLLEAVHRSVRALGGSGNHLEHMWGSILRGLSEAGWQEYEGRAELRPLLEELELPTQDHSGAPSQVVATASDVVRVLSEGEPIPEEVRDAQEVVGRALRKTVASAHHGFSVGGYDEASLAVHLLKMSWNDVLWSDLTAYIGDPRLGMEVRGKALAILAREPSGFPTDVPFSANVVIESPLARALLRDGGARVPGEGLAFARVYGLIGESELRRYSVDDLMRGDSRRRHELAEAFCNIAWGIPGQSAWARQIIQVLTYDRDPLVRAEGVFAWPSFFIVEKEDEEALFEVRQALSAGGVRVPLRALHGLQYLNNRGGVAPSALSQLLERLAVTAESSVLRGAARVVLSGMA